MLKWPFQWLSDLQLWVEKVTLNHLAFGFWNKMNGLHFFSYIFSGGTCWKNHLIYGSFLQKKLMIEGCNHPFFVDVFLGETCRVFLGFPRVFHHFTPTHGEVHLLRREVAWLQRGESRTQSVLASFFGARNLVMKIPGIRWVVATQRFYSFSPLLTTWGNDPIWCAYF